MGEGVVKAAEAAKAASIETLLQDQTQTQQQILRLQCLKGAAVAGGVAAVQQQLQQLQHQLVVPH